MNQGKYVFAQISLFLPQRIFDRIVCKYKGNYKIRHFSCWNQLLCMMFGQLSSRESLSDLVLTINAHPGKLYHLGFGKSVSKTNLARANEQREWLIYQEYAYYLISEERKICLPDVDNAFSFTNSALAGVPKKITLRGRCTELVEVSPPTIQNKDTKKISY